MRLRRGHLLILIALLPLYFTFINPRIPVSARQTVLTVLKPFLQVGNVVSRTCLGTRDTVIRFWNSFQNQTYTEKQIAALKADLIYYEETRLENQRLKQLLQFKDTVSGKNIAARLLGWDLSPWRKTAILDKGALDGIRKDMTIIVPEGLVGRVIEVSPSTARVISLLDSESRVSVTAATSRAQGVISGNGTNSLEMEYLNLDSGVEVGEDVISSGTSSLFPKGIAIGKIVSLSQSNDGLHMKADVEPFVRFSKLEEVLCLESYPEK